MQILMAMGLLGALVLLTGCATDRQHMGQVAPSSRAIVTDVDFLPSYVVLFDFDSSTINRSGQAVLDEVTEIETLYPPSDSPVQFQVTGYTDRAGTYDYNMALSLRRAKVVRDVLIARGFSPDSITVSARGETEPATPTADGAKEPANRRVVITVR